MKTLQLLMPLNVKVRRPRGALTLTAACVIAPHQRFLQSGKGGFSVISVLPRSDRCWLLLADNDRKKKKRVRICKAELKGPFYLFFFHITPDQWKLLTGQGLHSAGQDECRVLHRLRGCGLLNLSLSPFSVHLSQVE